MKSRKLTKDMVSAITAVLTLRTHLSTTVGLAIENAELADRAYDALVPKKDQEALADIPDVYLKVGSAMNINAGGYMATLRFSPMVSVCYGRLYNRSGNSAASSQVSSIRSGDAVEAVFLRHGADERQESRAQQVLANAVNFEDTLLGQVVIKDFSEHRALFDPELAAKKASGNKRPFGWDTFERKDLASKHQDLIDDIQAHSQKCREHHEAIDTFEAKTRATIQSYGTTKKLVEAWPELVEIMKDGFFGEEGVTLPTVQLDEIKEQVQAAMAA